MPIGHHFVALYSIEFFTIIYSGECVMADWFSALVFPLSQRKFRTVFLAFCWCMGLLLGAFLAQHAGEVHLSLMRRAVSCPVSIVGLFAVLLPFLFTAFAVVISNCWLYYPIAFFKAFLFSYHACVVSAAFGSAGWLVRYLFLFTDACTIPILLWLWILGTGNHNSGLLRRTVICTLLSVAVGMIDFCFVSPFLAMLIST